MNSSDMASLVPNPDDLLIRTVEQQGRLLLELIAKEHNSPQTAVAHSNFFNRANDRMSPPKYGARQREVDEALMEAWSWLESQSLLSRMPSSSGSWLYVGKVGQEFLKRNALYEQLERLGADRVKSELNKDRPRIGNVGGGSIEKDWAWDWLRMKERQQDTARGATGNRTNERVELSRRAFIVHGHDEGARESVARFLERLGLEPVILHEQANRGRTIIEKFEAHKDVGFAVVLLTPDDEGCEKGGVPRPRSRQNVVLELGYFVGVLGRDRVCALRRGEVEIPSDFTGVVYVPFDESDGWKQALGRELEAAGFEVDWKKAMGRT